MTKPIESVLLFLSDLSRQWSFYKRDGAFVRVNPPRRLLEEADQSLGFDGELLSWIEQRGFVQRFEEFETFELFRDFVAYEFPDREVMFRHGRTETIGYNLVVVVAPTGDFIDQPIRHEGHASTTKKVLILFEKTQTLVISEKCDISEADLNFLFKANPRFVGPGRQIGVYNCPLAFNRHGHLQLAVSIARTVNMNFDPAVTKLNRVSLPDLGTLAVAWAARPE